MEKEFNYDPIFLMVFIYFGSFFRFLFMFHPFPFDSCFVFILNMIFILLIVALLSFFLFFISILPFNIFFNFFSYLVIGFLIFIFLIFF